MKRGMHYMYYGRHGTARKFLRERNMMQLGKQELHRRSVQGIPTINLSHVGFAPYENPEIAYAIIIPNISTNPRVYTVRTK